MAEALEFRREWVIQMKEILHKDVNPRPNVDPTLRVATPLLKTKPEAYFPQFLSLGPYHHSKLQRDYTDSSSAERRISTAEAHKCKFAAMLSQELRKCSKSFKTIVEMIGRMRPEIERFYHWPIKTEGEYSQNFALMLTVDSFFLLCFLKISPSISPVYQAQSEGSPDSNSLDVEVFSLHTIYGNCIWHDIVKLENQIPLHVVKIVFENAKDALKYHDDFNRLLLRVCNEWMPFSVLISGNEEWKRITDALAAEPHILGCFHAFISRFVSVEEEQMGKETVLRRFNQIFDSFVIRLCRFLPTIPKFEQEFLEGFSAVQLARIGIKFKPSSKLPNTIRLDKYSGTLYLPKILVPEPDTEILLRNLLALEFNDGLRLKTVMSYVSLMCYLIQSPADVRILVDQHVLVRSSDKRLSDEDIVKIWNDLCNPFIGGQLPRPLCGPLYEFLGKRYYTTKIKRTIWGLADYVSSWKFIAPVSVFLGIVMTAIQTYCSLYQLLVPHR